MKKRKQLNTKIKARQQKNESERNQRNRNRGIQDENLTQLNGGLKLFVNMQLCKYDDYMPVF